MKFPAHKISAPFLIWTCLFSLPAQSTENKWDGWYGGLNGSFKSTKTTANYAHQHIGTCTNLNFGSEWPGDSCEGNQDYQTSVNSDASSFAAGLFVERLWNSDGRVYGLRLDALGGSENPVSQSILLSHTWGDTLNFDVHLKESVNVRAIVGFPQDDWLPFVTMGAVFQKAGLGFQQDQPPYNLPVNRNKDQWVSGGILGMGIKKQWGAEWIVTAELLYQKLNTFELSSDGVLLSGGLKYPTTNLDVNSDTRTLRVGIARRF